MKNSMPRSVSPSLGLSLVLLLGCGDSGSGGAGGSGAAGPGGAGGSGGEVASGGQGGAGANGGGGAAGGEGGAGGNASGGGGAGGGGTSTFECTDVTASCVLDANGLCYENQLVDDPGGCPGISSVVSPQSCADRSDYDAVAGCKHTNAGGNCEVIWYEDGPLLGSQETVCLTQMSGEWITL